MRFSRLILFNILGSFVASFLFIIPVFSQFYPFGRNKVQYTDFQWKVLKTEHFDIYYYPEMKELAERGAAYAEVTYGKLAEKFNHTVTTRIPLILYSSHFHFQQTNVVPDFIPEGVGGFFEFLKGRVVIPSQGSTDDFFHVIRHELSHVFMHSKINRVLSDHRQSPDRYVPLWFTEGLAEYFSTKWDTQAEMILRDAVLNNYIVPLSQMERIYGTFLMYKEGQAILEFIANRFGEEKVVLLIENLWRSNNFNEVMKFVIGKNYEEFDELWLYSLKKRYYPFIATEDLPINASQKLVTIGFNSKPIYYASNGKRWIYFIGNHTGYTSIYRKDIDDEKAKPELIIEGEQTDEFEAFSPFRTRLDISRNGIMVFVTKSGENDVIHLFNLSEESLERTIKLPAIVNINSVCWSPDGSKLAISALNKAGNNDLYILDINNDQLQKLTNDFYDDRTPIWTPNGEMLIFSSDRTIFGYNGSYNLFLYDLKTANIQYLTYGKENYFSPCISPNGKSLVFVSDFDGAQNVWMMKIESGGNGSRLSNGMKKITRFATAALDPSFIDDNELVLTSFENYGFQIRRVSKINNIYDTTAIGHHFDYNIFGENWVPSKIEGQSVLADIEYKGQFSLDIAQSQVSADPIFGTSGGAALAISDMLGNEQYYFLIYNNAQTKDEFLESFNIAISQISLSKRANYAYGIYRLAGNRYDLTDPNLFYYERAYGGYFVLSYPLSSFRRIESGISLTNSDKDDYMSPLSRKALLVSNSISLVSDNSLWGPTGPLDGHRGKLLFAYTTDVQHSNVNYFTVIADYRHYFRLSQRSALAGRLNFWYNEGKEARRFIMGGSWDLRGWPHWGIRGQKLWLASLELRFPFIDAIGLRLPFGGITFGAIRGALFTDFGNAWDKIYRDTKGSVGGGIRFNIGGVIVLRYDVGKRIEENMKRFQKGLFYQFFFGWDF